MMRQRFPQLRWPLRAGAHSLPIGVDFAAERLHMVQCVRRADGLAIRAAVSQPYPAERSAFLADRRALKKFVHAALAAAPFDGRRVHSALPPAEVRIVPLALNTANGQSEAALVIKALREKLRSDLSGEVVDYLPVRSAETAGTEATVLAAVAQRDKVIAHLHQLEAVGLEPVALDIGPAALARLLAAVQRGDDHEHAVLLINFGAERSYITVVSGRRLILDRELEFGEVQLIARLARALTVDAHVAQSMLQTHGARPDPAGGHAGASDMTKIIDEILHSEFSLMAEEIGRTLIYVASRTRGKAAETVYLNGSLAHYRYVVAKMRTLVDAPIEILNPLSMLPLAATSACDVRLAPVNGMALAAGLALRE